MCDNWKGSGITWRKLIGNGRNRMVEVRDGGRASMNFGCSGTQTPRLFVYVCVCIYIHINNTKIQCQLLHVRSLHWGKP